MKDPYIVLGVSQSDTDEEITKAYRELAKKYHPDNYADSPLASYATEKMQEINEAYDQIRKERKNANSGNSNYYASNRTNYSYGNSSYGNSNYNTDFHNGNVRYHDVRMMIKNGRLADADQILSGVLNANRDAEWYFLKGTVLYRKGWTEQASMHFQQALNMDPTNTEYQAAYNQMNARRSGSYGGYNTNTNMNAKGCSSCDVCTSLLCADCCCECMGCDFISCC